MRLNRLFTGNYFLLNAMLLLLMELAELFRSELFGSELLLLLLMELTSDCELFLAT